MLFHETAPHKAKHVLFLEGVLDYGFRFREFHGLKEEENELKGSAKSFLETYLNNKTPILTVRSGLRRPFNEALDIFAGFVFRAFFALRVQRAAAHRNRFKPF